MKLFNRFLFLPAVLFFFINMSAQTDNSIIKNALLIANHSKRKIENCEQLLVVYNYQPESYSAFLVALERKKGSWVVKYNSVEVGVGKNGFAPSQKKIEGDGKSPTGIFRLGKIFTYEKKLNTLLEYQQITKEDKWIDDPNSDDYNKYIRGSTNAKSYENLLLNNDAYKYCIVIEYNMNPVVKGKGSAIFFHLGVKKPYFTAGCVAINEENMKLIVNWLDPKLNPTIIMGNYNVLKREL